MNIFIADAISILGSFGGFVGPTPKELKVVTIFLLFCWLFFGFISSNELKRYQNTIMENVKQLFPDDFQDISSIKVKGINRIAPHLRRKYPQIAHLPMIKHLNLLELIFFSIAVLPILIILPVSGIFYHLKIIGIIYEKYLYIGSGICYLFFTIVYTSLQRYLNVHKKQEKGTFVL